MEIFNIGVDHKLYQKHARRSHTTEAPFIVFNGMDVLDAGISTSHYQAGTCLTAPMPSSRPPTAPFHLTAPLDLSTAPRGAVPPTLGTTDLDAYWSSKEKKKNAERKVVPGQVTFS